MDLSFADHAVAALSAVGAGFVNSIAGGGTLISFPALLAVGVPSVRANVTNAVALCPGYFGGTWAQRADLAEQPRMARAMVAPSALGGLAGSILLVVSPEKLFRSLVPFLILTACALLAFQVPIRTALDRARARRGRAAAVMSTAGVSSSSTVSDPAEAAPRSLLLATFVASIYGGYFGAGLGIITIAVLGLLLDGPLPKLNALKQLIAAAANVVAALFFSFSGKVEWSLVLVMAPASLLGGQVGGRLVKKIPARPLRIIVVAFGVAVAIKQWL